MRINELLEILILISLMVLHWMRAIRVLISGPLLMVRKGTRCLMDMIIIYTTWKAQETNMPMWHNAIAQLKTLEMERFIVHLVVVRKVTVPAYLHFICRTDPI